MGCEDLGEIVHTKKTALREFSGQKLAIDAAFWFQRYYHASVKEEFSPEERTVQDCCDVSQAIALLISLPDLFRYNIIPVFVFDPMRNSRPSKAKTNVPYLENTPDVSEPEKHFPFLQRPTELLLSSLDIPFCEAPLYADADASVFAREERVDVVVSNDYDTVLYGSPLTIRKSFDSHWEKIDINSILEQNGLNYRELLDVAILVGTDEVQGPYKENIEEAVTEVRQASDIEELESEYNEVLRGPSLRVNAPAPKFQDLHHHYQNPPVTPYSARPEPSSPDPDISGAGKLLYEYIDIKIDKINSLLDPIWETID